MIGKLKVFLFFNIVFISGLLMSQVPPNYPENQEFYKNGETALNKEIYDIIQKNNYQKCSSPKEFYQAAVLIREDGTAAFVKDFDTLNIQKNNCAYTLFRKILPELKNWSPAELNGKKFRAIAEVSFFPSFYFNQYTEGQRLKDALKEPEYNEDNKKFKQKLVRTLTSKLRPYDRVSHQYTLTFKINDKGEMENYFLMRDDGDPINALIRNEMEKFKNGWAPATISGVPIDYTVKVPFNVTVY